MSIPKKYLCGKSGHPHEWTKRFNSKTGKPYKVCKTCRHVDEESYNASKTNYNNNS